MTDNPSSRVLFARLYMDKALEGISMSGDVRTSASLRGSEIGPAGGVGRTLWLVAIVALLAHALSLVGTQLWVYPDSIDYIALGGGLADRGDWANELFLVRPPGYPLLLAGIFRVFGSASPLAIQIVQHLMAVVTVVLTAAIAWRLTGTRIIPLVAGLLGAFSLQSLAYANLVLTETPFALTLVGCVLCLIVFVQEGRWRWLMGASLLVGIGYLFRPIGLCVLGACLLAVPLRLWCQRGNRDRGAPSPSLGRTLRHVVTGTVAAIAPAVMAAAPWMLKNAMQHDSLQGARTLDYVLYLRAVNFDNLDSHTSTAMNDIHSVVEEAIAKGHLPSGSSFRDRATVIQAYQAVRGVPFAVSSGVMGEAARDIMKEQPEAIALNTLKYAYWMLLSPDPVYRFQAGGAPGIDGQKDANAELFDIGTYAFGAGSWERVLKDHRHHLPLTADTKAATPFLQSAAEWYLRNVDAAPAILGVLDSRYEQWMVFIGLAGLLTMLTWRRTEWLVVAAVIALHVLASAFLGGPQTRYVLPIRTLLLLYAAFGFCALGDLIYMALTARKRDRATANAGVHQVGRSGS